MVRFGSKRMSGTKAGKPVENDRPLQTPVAGALDQNGQNNGSGSNLNMEDVPVSAAKPSGAPIKPINSESINTDKTKEIIKKVDNATKTMEQNIQAATQRGESLNELQDKTRTIRSPTTR